MRKAIVLLIMLLLCLQPVSVFAASAPEILNEPQNLVWPENSVACYSVEAYGDDLSYKWYIICDEVTYDTTIFEEGLPWIGFGMSGCGASADGKTFYINGITNEANGAQIFCEVTNGAGSVRSRAATISVGGSALPPNIKVVPGIIVEMNRPASIMCTASDPQGGTVEYIWMETTTGELKDVVAINRGTETNETLNCDTSTPGTRYFVCMVTTSNGGMGYSSVIPVTVTEQAETCVEILRTPDKVVYTSGECLDLTGLMVRVTTPEGSFISMNGEGLEITKNPLVTLGEQKIRVGYGDAMDIFIVTVNEAFHLHRFGEWMVTAEPTCTESGIKARECDCGYTEREEIPPTGHQWDEGKITKEPTEDSDGERTFSCTVCKETKKEIIKADKNDSEPTEGAEATGSIESPIPTGGSEAFGGNQPSGTEPSYGFPWWLNLILIIAIGIVTGSILFILNKKKK